MAKITQHENLRSYPLSYITGQISFMQRQLQVDSRVYIPNRETERLVKYAAHYIRARFRHPRLILDVGTGCGNIGISLASIFPESRVIATDISADALEVATSNAQRKCLHNISFLETNLTAGLEQCPSVIVCNLPWGREEFMLRSNSKERLSFMPPVSIYPPKGVIGCYLELYKQAALKKWNTIIMAEVGRIDRATVAREIPPHIHWKMVSSQKDYGILLLDLTKRK